MIPLRRCYCRIPINFLRKDPFLLMRLAALVAVPVLGLKVKKETMGALLPVLNGVAWMMIVVVKLIGNLGGKKIANFVQTKKPQYLKFSSQDIHTVLGLCGLPTFTVSFLSSFFFRPPNNSATVQKIGHICKT